MSPSWLDRVDSLATVWIAGAESRRVIARRGVERPVAVAECDNAVEERKRSVE